MNMISTQRHKDAKPQSVMVTTLRLCAFALKKIAKPTDLQRKQKAYA